MKTAQEEISLTSHSPKPEPPSLWAATARPGPSYPALAGSVRSGTVVVGGGFTGLSTALHLAEAGRDVALLEAHSIGWGASGRNGGQVIAGLKYDPDELEEMFGPQLGPRLVRAAGEGPDYLFRLIERLGIRCDARQTGWIQPAHSDAALAAVQRRARQWQARGAAARVLDRGETAALIGSDVYRGGWLDGRGGAIQPLAYARGLAAAAADRGARLHAGSPALRVARDGDGWRVETPGGAVTADTLVLATNAYTDDLWPPLRRSVVPTFSLQVATDPLPEAIRRTILPQGHVASDTLRLLRYYQIDGNGRFVLGARGPFRDDVGPAHAGEHLRHIRQLYPQLDGVPLRHVWSGQVAMTADHLPHLHALAPGVFAALGYNGRGVALTTTMGRFLAALVSGAPAEAVDFPVTPLRPLPLHRFNRLAVRVVTQYYRLRDRFS